MQIDEALPVQKSSSDVNNTNADINTSANLEKQLEILNQRLYRKTNPKHIFLLGLIQGIGYTFGATIVAGLVLFLAVQMIASIDYLPVINQFLSSEGVREVLQSLKEI